MNVVEEIRDDETPASNNGINCNNGLGIGNNGRGINVRKSSSRVNGECAINIIQRVWRGSRIRRSLTATERILIQTGGDQDLVALHKFLRVMDKKLRQSISRGVTGSGRQYNEALSIGRYPSIVIQRYVRRFLAKKLCSKMRREYARRLLANKLNIKIKMTKDGCYSTPITCVAPSHTSDSSQSSTTTDTNDLGAQYRDVMDDGKNGEILDDVDSNEYTNTLSNDFPSWGDKYSGAAYEDFGGWGATRGLIKDWSWLARLAEKLTHRGLIYYGVYLIVIISGLIMCVTPVADTLLLSQFRRKTMLTL